MVFHRCGFPTSVAVAALAGVTIALAAAFTAAMIVPPPPPVRECEAACATATAECVAALPRGAPFARVSLVNACLQAHEGCLAISCPNS